MKNLATCLWFNDKAEEAANFYVSVFSGLKGSKRKSSKILTVSRYGEAAAKISGKPEGSAMTVTFRLDGRDFMALNGGPQFTFSPAFSLIVNCENQKEVDYFWEKLSEGGKPGQCGWLEDKFGFSWQIVPTILGDFLKGSDPRRTERVMAALLQMKKLDIQGLKQAYGKP